jgi:hypothetical protein
VEQLLTNLGITKKPIMHQRIMDRVMLLNSGDSELLMGVLGKLKSSHPD